MWLLQQGMVMGQQQPVMGQGMPMQQPQMVQQMPPQQPPGPEQGVGGLRPIQVEICRNFPAPLCYLSLSRGVCYGVQATYDIFDDAQQGMDMRNGGVTLAVGGV